VYLGAPPTFFNASTMARELEVDPENRTSG
jgi:hypothetical protein